ncbi:MAG: family 20 glycosylhydrolase [Glaciecola sp.]
MTLPIFSYRNKTRALALILASSVLSACYAQNTHNNAQPNNSHVVAIEHNAQHMQVKYQVNTNTAPLTCKANDETGDCYSSTLSLVFSQDLPATGWRIMFSHLSPIQTVTSEHFSISRINGDLHELTPLTPITANTEYSIDLISQFWSVSTSDVLPNYFFVSDNNQTALIQSTTEVIGNANDLPIRPHAGSYNSYQQIHRNASDNSKADTHITRYERNAAIHNEQALAPEHAVTRIIPQINTVTTKAAELDLRNGFTLQLHASDVENVKHNLSKASALLPMSQHANAVPLHIQIDPAYTHIPEQGYTLKVASDKVTVSASDTAGGFYALVSLAQLITHNKLAQGDYIDAPKFSFRGVHLDVGRNFRGLDFVKGLIQQMAYLKLNKLHLHLADDEGWRLQIEGLPELTDVGAYRCYDPSERNCLLPQLGSGPNKTNTANGYYSKSDYIELLKFAQVHHVEVIPSLDMPGHSRAAIKAMEARYYNLLEAGFETQANEYLLTEFADTTQYSSVQHYNDNTINPCLPATYRFVDKVLGELVSMHNAADVPLKRYHIGADETAGAWHQSPICNQYIAQHADINNVADLMPYFITRVAKVVENKGIIAAGWSDGMRAVDKTNIAPMQVNVWDTLMSGGHKAAYQFTENGWRSVLSFPDVLYFDFPYAVNPNEPGYYWATRASDSYKVFQFSPDYPAQNARLWVDRMGNAMNLEEQTFPNISTQGMMEGIQAHLWSEVVRHDKVAEYMYFPRLSSVAENAWANKQWQQNIPQQSTTQWLASINRDWQAFSFALSNKLLPYLAAQNVNFRVPAPGAKYIGKKWHLNHLYTGMQLQYKVGNGQWTNYTSAITTKGLPVLVRAKIPNTERVSPSVNLQHAHTNTQERH